MPALDDPRSTQESDQTAADGGLVPGALSALLVRLAAAPASDPGGGWGLLPEPGTVIGRFELVREIGRGGFGVVYEARDRELPRSVAFKLVRPGLLQVGEDQLRREADAIAQLSHPNLVTLFDVGRSDYGPYLVLELLRGETLDARLRRGPLPAQEAVALAVEVARGMGHAHGVGVVHRDLKPSNVFLCQGGQVKLLDFGMSHAFGRQRLSGGTPGYMAPEQWRGEPEDERTDVWALGVILFQALSGQLPFPSDDEGQTVLSSRPAPLLTVKDAPGLSRLVRRMLEKAPERRPRGAAEVLEALEESRQAQAPARVRPRLRSRPVLVAALVVAALAAVVLAIGLARSRGGPAPGPAPGATRALAVVPFRDLSGLPGAATFNAGLTEEIRHRLTRVRGLRVAAGASAPGEAAGSAGAWPVMDVVLEGSVRREADQLRVAIELVDARSGFRLWSQIYDRRGGAGFAVQEDVARQVAGAVELVLGAAGTGTADPSMLEAYDLYLRGRAALRTPADLAALEQAVQLFEQAIAADPRFAVSQAGLCDAWLARYRFTSAAPDFQRAERACQVALEREPTAGAVHQAMGSLHLAAGDAARAERELSQAAALATYPVEALLGLASAQVALGRPEVAEATLDRAQRIDPGDWRVARQRGHLRFAAGRHAEAAEAYAEVVTRTPESAAAHANLGAARHMAGDFSGAVAAYRAALALGPSASALSNLGSAEFYLGHFDEAAVLYRRATELAPGDHVFWGNLGDALTFAGGGAADAAGAYGKAVELARRQLGINREDHGTRSDLARYLARLGEAGPARRERDQALGQAGGDQYVQYNAALVDLALEEPGPALDALERAVAAGYPPRLLPHDAALVSVRGLRRFLQLSAPHPSTPAANTSSTNATGGPR